VVVVVVVQPYADIERGGARPRWSLRSLRLL